MERLNEIVISGETFDIKYEGDVVFVTHPRWSLLGVGRSFKAAWENLYEEAAWITSALSQSNSETFSEDLRHLVDFINQQSADY